MWEVVLVFAFWLGPHHDSPPPQRPYVSCLDGHIVEDLSQCPPLPKRSNNTSPPVGGGGGGGLLGGLIGGVL